MYIQKNSKSVEVDILRVTTRVGYDGKKFPTRGVLLIDDQILGTTLELPWVNNERRVSCIPLGCYRAVRVRNVTTSGGLHIPVTYRLQDVPDRDGILFHVGNTAKDTEGCILVGLGYGIINGYRGILQSKLGFDMFMEATKGVDTLTVRIRDDDYKC